MEWDGRSAGPPQAHRTLAVGSELTCAATAASHKTHTGVTVARSGTDVEKWRTWAQMVRVREGAEVGTPLPLNSTVAGR